MIQALEQILERPRVVLTFMVVSLVAGIFAYTALPKEARPDIQVPVYYVSIPLQGVSPEDAVRLLIKPMEDELRGVEGLKELTAIAAQGFGALIVEFDADIDTKKAGDDVREKVDLAKSKLPDDAEEPKVTEVNLNLFPTMIVSLAGNVPERTLYRHARELQDAIEAIPAVLEARLNGQREELLEVIVDRLKLESYNISQSDLVTAVTRNNRLVAAGEIDAGGGRFNVKVPGLIEGVEDVYAIPIKVNGDAVVTLGQVAEIRPTFKDPTRYARTNGRPSMTIQVIKRVGENIITTNDEVRRVVEKTAAAWPSSLHISYALDESKRIFEQLGTLQSSILTAIALVMIVVVAALGTRSALLVGMAIPTSFMLGFAIVELLGKSINNMMLFGMVLTVGMLVDGAIVIVEYADRKMVEGLARRDAYKLAAKRMLWPIVSSTATTLAAFLPMLLWPGIPGKFMSNLPTTVIIVLSASLLTAMVFLPVLGGIFGKADASATSNLAKLAAAERNDVRALSGATGLYVRALARLINHPAKVIVAALIVMGGIFYAYAKHNNGVMFFVETEPEQALIYVRARGNLSVDEKLAMTREVERIVMSVEGVETVATLAGSAGNTGLGSGAGLDQPKDAIGQLTIELKPYGTRPPGKQILGEIRRRTAHMPGMYVEVRERENGPRTGKDIRLQVRAGDVATANAVARQVRQHLEKDVANLIDIEDETPLPGVEWTLAVNRREAGRFGADIVSVGAIVQLITNGVLIGTYRPDDSRDEVDIRVRLPRNERALDQLATLRLRTRNGLVPLANFIDRQVKPQVDTIIRKDGLYSVFVKANVTGGVLADTKVKELRAWLDGRKWPAGVQFVFRGADEEQKKSMAFLSKAMVASVFIMFMILLTQFNSIYHALLTLMTLVMSLSGVLLGMLVTGQSFSVIMTGTGVVALAGIVVNNAIVLIDTYHVLRKDGYAVREAVLRTAGQRLRPVLLTTVTTIFGLLPMIFQINVDWLGGSVGIGSLSSSWWVQLATAISFGLAFATLLTLLLTPVLLAAPTVWGQSLARLIGRGGKQQTASELPAAGEPGKAAGSGKRSRRGKSAAKRLPEAAE